MMRTIWRLAGVVVVWLAACVAIAAFTSWAFESHDVVMVASFLLGMLLGPPLIAALEYVWDMREVGR